MSDPITRVKESDGELVLDYDSRVGARPYARFVDGEWDVMSLSHVPTPAYGDPDDSETGHNTEVHTVDLAPDSISETELREMAKHPRYPTDDDPEWAGVVVIPFDESPFAHRDDIPAKEEIVQDVTCDDCGDQFRQYIPEPLSECPYCGATAPQPD